MRGAAAAATPGRGSEQDTILRGETSWQTKHVSMSSNVDNERSGEWGVMATICSFLRGLCLHGPARCHRSQLSHGAARYRLCLGCDAGDKRNRNRIADYLHAKMDVKISECTQQIEEAERQGQAC
mmetsp:Transcript_6082/g.12712  ORF Transcript_6082/g.12712 Transcript_6082/m.12712 type:complete len:125 (-) Transcript_6082:96-470(-)